MKLICSVLVLLILLGCVNQKKIQSENIEEVIYQKKNTHVLDVYNLTKLHFSQEDIEYLDRRNFKYGEFGGQIKICSNDEYYCLIGGIGVVIPKKLAGQKEWEFADEKCQSESPLSYQQPAIITCNSKGWSNKFVYSFDRGIISYVIAAQPEFEHELVDEKGLFANADAQVKQ
jgi:hypothetical protein